MHGGICDAGGGWPLGWGHFRISWTSWGSVWRFLGAIFDHVGAHWGYLGPMSFQELKHMVFSIKVYLGCVGPQRGASEVDFDR